MVDEIVLVYDKPEDREKFESIPTSRPITITYYDYGSKLSKKKAWSLMETWGARKLPFAVLSENNKVITCLYTENKNRVIEDLKTYL